MKITDFAAQIQALQHHADRLLQTQDQHQPATVLPEVVEEFHSTLEELQVAQEELLRQNAELWSARQTIEAERRRYQELFDFAPDGYLVTDPNGVIQEANRAAAALLRVPPGFLVGKPLFIFTAPAEHRTFYSRLCQLLQAQQPEEWEIRLQPRGEGPIDALLTVAPTHDTEGHAISLRWLVRDLTHRKQAEARYRALFENALEGIFRSTPEGRFLEVNPALVHMLGYDTAEELLALRLPDDLYMDPAQRESHRARYEATGIINGVELVWKKKDGTPIVVTLHARTINDARGTVAGYEGMVLDLTERKQMEEALRASEERYRIISHMISDYAFALRVTEQGTTFLEWLTESFTHVTGYPVAEMVGKPDPWRVYIHPDDLERVHHVLSTITPEAPKRYEFRLIRKDGSVRWLRSHIRAVRGQEGLRIYGSTQDITERRQAEEEIRTLNAELERRVLERTAQLQESEARYRQLFENANDAIAIVSRDGRVVAVNQKMFVLTGLPQEAFVGKTPEELLPSSVRASVRQKLRQALIDGRVGPYELPVRTPLGRKTFSINTFTYCQDGVAAGTINIARDITEELRQKQERDNLYQFTHDLVRCIDTHTVGELLFAHAQTMLGADYGDLMLAPAGGTELKRLAAYGVGAENFAEEWVEVDKESAVVSLAVRQRRPVIIEDYPRNPLISERLRQKYHFLRDVWATPLISGEKLVGIFSAGFLTPQQPNLEKLRFLQLLGNEAALALERVRLIEQLQESEQRFRALAQEREQQLIASDRLVSVGELAASLAHEFNNPLYIVLGFIQDLLTEVKPSDPLHRPLAIIEEEARRCQKLVRDLLDFARPTPANPCWADLKEIIQKSVELVSAPLQKRQVNTEIDIRPDLPLVYVDAQQLQQVLLNLFFNAIEAMPAGGTLTVRVAITASERSVGQEGESPEVCIVVADTGIGIDPHDMEKIFRPFFSAKKAKGMGLGLSICEGIIKAHGGRIEVASTPGQGTTFSLFFPLTHSLNTAHV